MKYFNDNLPYISMHQTESSGWTLFKLNICENILCTESPSLLGFGWWKARACFEAFKHCPRSRSERPCTLAWSVTLTLTYGLDLQSLASYGHELVTWKVEGQTVSLFWRWHWKRRTDGQTDEQTALNPSLMRSINMHWRVWCIESANVQTKQIQVPKLSKTILPAYCTAQ